MPNYNIFNDIYNSMFIEFGIKRNKEYQFVYDEFFDHLINDTNIFFVKNNKHKGNMSEINYKLEIFKTMFFNHFKSSSMEKIIYPDRFPELKRRIRIDKLNKLLV